jgi:hypothetical protein
MSFVDLAKVENYDVGTVVESQSFIGPTTASLRNSEVAAWAWCITLKI